MTYSFLALGDSYTIGEGIPLDGSFPCQTVQLLRAAGKSFYAPEIVARTGWTTDELTAALSRYHSLPHYDFISLLIGVNNQYRRRGLEEYGLQFEALLLQAIRLSGSWVAGHHSPPDALPSQAPRVFVLSIPDWSLTPYAHASLPDPKGRSRTDVAHEIDAFNLKASAIARKYGVTYLDITTHGREAGESDKFGGDEFAPDGLHPSAAQYSFWAQQLSDAIQQTLVAESDHL